MVSGSGVEGGVNREREEKAGEGLPRATDDEDFEPADHLRDVWAKLTPDERLQRTLRLHYLRKSLLAGRDDSHLKTTR